ncbi:GLPGLI family protein [Flavobacterium sp. K5-23]|uniref:GLPGLI family protein n=1 Tax=Flavobacterium sp. K5-23 TaxID=2746225 RepID=UPI00200ED571|nr:GLPGLI family protein [Flavobacterium sp. K5-23]UQD55255.1 GLPGLI family protein [Flavobacterium sp. K5-23]
MKKLKILFFYIALTTMLGCYSQALSGKVIYKIQLVGYGEDNKKSEFNELNAATIEIANKQTVTLSFNNEKSSSVLDSYLITEDGDRSLRKFARSMAFIVTNGSDYFYDKSTNTAIERIENGQLINKPHKKLEWEITTESKMIGDYLCYKAIYLFKFVNRAGENRNRPITTWFAPSLPYSYGPKYFNGLPGLILEVQDLETTFYATSIHISQDKELQIDFPKGKTIPKEEYDKKMKVQMGM